MSNIVLSKDADKSLCIIYKEYLSRRKNNVSKSSAIVFDEPSFKTIFPLIDLEDFMSDLSELSQNNLIKLYVDGSFIFMPAGIIYMENRFKNGLIDVTDFIAKFIP